MCDRWRSGPPTGKQLWQNDLDWSGTVIVGSLSFPSGRKRSSQGWQRRRPLARRHSTAPCPFARSPLPQWSLGSAIWQPWVSGSKPSRPLTAETRKVHLRNSPFRIGERGTLLDAEAEGGGSIQPRLKKVAVSQLSCCSFSVVGS